MAAIVNTGMALLHDNGLVLPADLSLLFRVMLQLQGLGRALDTEVRVAELLQPYMKKLLAERFDPRRLARHAGRTFRGWDRLAASLPGDIEDIVQQIRAGRLAIDFRVHDADGAVDHLVDGLVAAASVLGSAQLLSRRTGPTVGQVSVPGLVAAGVGVITWQRLVRRRRERKTWVSRTRELAELRRHPRSGA
jgi:ubiquinone biosynthesis protein